MRTIRFMFRLIKWLMIGYGAWSALLRGRWVAMGLALFGALSRGTGRDARKRANWMFVNAGEPAIYRRRGHRKIAPARTR